MGKTIKPFLGIPIYGSVNVHFFSALLQFLKEAKDFPHETSYVCGDSLVSRARNTISMEFLKSDCTHLLFIDSDLSFSLEQIKRILSHDEDIVGGFYPKKKDGAPELVFNATIPPSPMDSRRLTEVRYMGTGFLCISKKVFEKMISELGDELIFKLDGKEKIGFDFWPVGVYKFADGSRRYLSEDWYFCQRAIDLGFKVYGDNGILLKHCDTATIYPLQSQERALLSSVTKELKKDVALYDLAFDFTPKTILDIGANVGAFSERCSELWPLAQIMAFEPVESNFSQLKKNCPNVKSINKAVRDFNGISKIKIGNHHTTCSFHNLGEQSETEIDADCISASELPSCDLVKIDTEGCEVEILNGLDLSRTAAVVCEYHSENDKAAIEAIATQRGFNKVGWTWLNEGLGLLKFARADSIKRGFERNPKEMATA